MATLKDYLGTIVADINHARGLADIESARMAKEYAKDEVLQYYSIPRMRMQDVELTIPIGISKVSSKAPVDYQPIDNKTFYSHVYQNLKDVYKLESLKSDNYKQVSKIIKTEIKNLEKNIKSKREINLELNKFSTIIAKKTKENILNQLKETQVKKIEDITIPRVEAVKEFLIHNLKDQIKPLDKTTTIEDAEVIVESDKLRELKPEHLIQIKMKIIEQGMEWHKMENSDGEVVSKLTVE